VRFDHGHPRPGASPFLSGNALRFSLRAFPPFFFRFPLLPVSPLLRYVFLSDNIFLSFLFYHFIIFFLN